MISVFAPRRPARPRPGSGTSNSSGTPDTAARTARHRRPALLDFTSELIQRGWRPPIAAEPSTYCRWWWRPSTTGPEMFELPSDAVQEVALEHPELPWFAELGLRWHAVPVDQQQRLVIGGVSYPAAPFNGWYMGTEIGARNLGDNDRYDMVPDGRRTDGPGHLGRSHPVARPRSGRAQPRRTALVPTRTA